MGVMNGGRASVLIPYAIVIITLVVALTTVARAASWPAPLGSLLAADVMATRERFTAAASLSPEGKAELCSAASGQAAAACAAAGDGTMRLPRVSADALNVQGRLFFGDAQMSAAPQDSNRTDPVFVEKVTEGDARSALRITVNDDANDSVQIWGGACAAGDCMGSGKQQHRFDAGGTAWHASQVCVGDACLSPADVRQVKAAAGRGPSTGMAGKQCFELGQGVAGKEGNAGKLCYAAFSDGLDIVGAGNTYPGRKVRVWDNMQVGGTVSADRVCVGNACMAPADVERVLKGPSAPAAPAPPPTAALPGDACFEWGAGVAGKEGNAGKLCYAKFSDGLDIVGAGRPGAARKVRVWDELQTGGVLAAAPSGFVQVRPAGARLGGTPSGWGGGVHTLDVYAQGTVAVGNANGQIQRWFNGSGAFNLSDARAKTDVVSLGAEEVAGAARLRPVRYRRTDDPDRRLHYGFIAQEVAKEFPHLVQRMPDGKLALNSEELVPLLAAEVASLRAEVRAAAARR